MTLQCASCASNGPYHLGLCALQVRITFVIPSAVCGLYMLTRNSQISAFSAQDVLSQVMAGGAAASVVGVSMAMLDSLYFGTLFLSLDGTTAVGLTVRGRETHFLSLHYRCRHARD